MTFETNKRERNFKRNKILLYLKILFSVYSLRKEGAYAANWSIISKKTKIPEHIVVDTALELRANNFFDSNAREIGVVSLNEQQYKQGYIISATKLIYLFIKSFWLYKLASGVIAIFIAFILWFMSNLLYDVVKLVLKSMN